MRQPRRLLHPLLLALVICSPITAQVLCGDCDGNTQLTILDALLAAQHAVSIVTLTGQQFVACDVDISGTVTVLDALTVAQEAAGLAPVLICNTPPTCTITSPLGGSFGGEISVTFDTEDLDADLLDLTFEYSTDAGATWASCTPSVASPLANPALGQAAAAGLEFRWDALVDIPSALRPLSAELRVTVDDGTVSATCLTGSLDLQPGGVVFEDFVDQLQEDVATTTADWGTITASLLQSIPGPAPGPNIATSAIASSDPSGSTSSCCVAAKLNDGVRDCSQHWISMGCGSLGHWIQLDWPSPQTIVSMLMDTESVVPPCLAVCVAAGRACQGGTIQWWDGMGWVTDGTVVGEYDDWTYTFTTPLTTDRLRIFDLEVTCHCGQSSNPSMHEWEVYGVGAGTAYPPSSVGQSLFYDTGVVTPDYQAATTVIMATTPGATTVTMEYEGADDPVAGPFSGFGATPDVADGYRYIRFRATLTNTPSETPTIDSISIPWTP